LFNVLKGDMSLVGLRPWSVPTYKKEIAQGIYRKQILRPGLTGLVPAHKDKVAAMGGSLDGEDAGVDLGLAVPWRRLCESYGMGKEEQRNES